MKDASTGIGLEAAAVKGDAFAAATGVLTAVVAGVLGWLLGLWPPHEDEALALFVGRGSLGDVLHTVIAERGGAPLHFLFAWAVVHAGGGLTALRVVSLLFAVASVPRSRCSRPVLRIGWSGSSRQRSPPRRGSCFSTASTAACTRCSSSRARCRSCSCSSRWSVAGGGVSRSGASRCG